MSGYRRALLDIAAEVLTADPTATLAEVAAAAEISRTTLHKRYPKREDLLLAVGWDAVARLKEGIMLAELPVRGTAEHAERAMSALVAELIRHGAQVNFLLRQPTLDLDEELTAAVALLDEPVTAFVEHAQAVGVLKADLPPWWVVSSLYALTYAAWDAVRTGHQALLFAPGLVLRTFLEGAGG